MSQVDDLQAECNALQQKLIGLTKSVSRAVEILQGLEDVTVRSDDGTLEMMVCAHAVDHAVAILQEWQQSCGCDPSEHSLPSASDPDTVCAGCGRVVN
jgi:hypothetical protein